MAAYQATRDALVRRLVDVADRIASCARDLEEATVHHLVLSGEMNAEVVMLRTLDAAFVAESAAAAWRCHGPGRDLTLILHVIAAPTGALARLARGSVA